MLQQGLQAFVGQTIAHLNQHIGECWARGELTVAHEHLYTECVQTVLHGIIAAQPAGAASPRIVLTTVPGETHTLGLLMAEALWTAEGAACVSLGPQFPIADIPAVVQDGGYDIVALSFSLSFPSTHARNALRTLRSSLPSHVQIWAGGGALSQRHTIDGVRILGPIATASDALAEWRSQRG
jgi:methanogenic corrinoid protein MtbC1